MNNPALQNAALRLTVAIDPTDYFGCEDDIRLVANAALRPPTPAADQQTEREAFERTIRSLMLSERNPCEREVDSDGDSIYSNEFVRIAWVGWCCRAPLDACFAGGSPARDVEAPAAINQDVIDARRYRWLRDNCSSVNVKSDGKFGLPDYGQLAFLWHRRDWVGGKPRIVLDTLDEAIDKAMLAAAPIGSDK